MKFSRSQSHKAAKSKQDNIKIILRFLNNNITYYNFFLIENILKLLELTSLKNKDNGNLW